MNDSRRMSDAEALLWRLEKDPYLSSTFGTVSILDRAPDADRLRARLDQAVLHVPRLRWRVQPGASDFGAPVWADDPDFDVDSHVRRIALPKPGNMRQLLDLATLLVLDPFDRTRPLWQFVIIEGLRGGKAALLTKMHHTITDGEGGVRMSMQYLDLERDATASLAGATPTPRPDDESPSPGDSPLGGVRSFLESSARLPLSVMKQVRELLADPASIPHASAAAVDTVRSIVAQLSDSDAARSPLWTERSMRRRVEVARVPLAVTKDAACRLGGTLNTAFITAAAEAAARYHAEHDAPVDELRASMAISMRHGGDSAAANSFSLARMLVPTGDMPIGERFTRISDIAATARAVIASASLEHLATLTSALPTSFVTRLARQQAQTVDFATSNVRGAPVPVYIAGAKLTENYAIGPLAGVAFNMTMLSYDGSLDVGINTDAAAVDDPARLAKLVEQAFRRLHRAARI
ncbi:wax ester/triacylglycerol synthase family O-acyltransferase [soil metagenome]